MLLALRQVGRVENRVTHTNPGRHEKSDMRDFDILSYLYSKNKKKRKGDGFPTKPSIFSAATSSLPFIGVRAKIASKRRFSHLLP